MIKFKNKSGFSLIELSLTLVVLSSLAVLLMIKITAGRDGENQQQAINDLKKIKAAIEYYVEINGHYPCPASRTVQETNALFASELTRDVDGNCTLAGVASGFFEPNPTRFGSFYSVIPPGTAYVLLNNDVIQGTIPCKDIGLPKDCLFDPQGNRYEYMVIPALARSGKPAVIIPPSDAIPAACGKFYQPLVPVPPAPASLQSLSHIKMLKRWPDTSVDLATTYADSDNRYSYEPDFAVIYYGKDGMGARSRSGALVESAVATGSNYIGDNVYQEINHNLHATLDEYLFMPERPFDPGQTFGDIIIFGKNDTLRDNKVCVMCGDCNPALPAPPIYLSPSRVVNIDCDPLAPSPSCTMVSDVCTVIAGMIPNPCL